MIVAESWVHYHYCQQLFRGAPRRGMCLGAFRCSCTQVRFTPTLVHQPFLGVVATLRPRPRFAGGQLKFLAVGLRSHVIEVTERRCNRIRTPGRHEPTPVHAKLTMPLASHRKWARTRINFRLFPRAVPCVAHARTRPITVESIELPLGFPLFLAPLRRCSMRRILSISITVNGQA